MIICGTGHRPNKLGGYGEAAHSKVLETAYRSLEYLKPSEVISGMALGWDTALAEAALGFKIPLIAAAPFKGQESQWPEKSQKEYQRLLSFADKIVYVTDNGYSPSAMQVRNQWMVDNCDRVLALWNGDQSGGTYNCIKYAKSVRKPSTNAWKCYQYLKRFI